MTAAALATYEIVLTTYDVLVNDADGREEEEEGAAGDDDTDRDYDGTRSFDGALHQVRPHPI